MDPQIITVSQFIAIINETLAFAYPQVMIEGEVSSFKVNQGKWVFFDLKDDGGVLSCFMVLPQLKFPVEDGMKVRVTGSPKVMNKSSKFSLTVRDLELAGVGELKRAMELLKKKLEGEGLFDPARKRPIPQFPQRLGLITSGTSAAYHDFVKILGSRWGGLDVLLADVSVQGGQAPDQIVAAIDYFNQLRDPVDVLVLIRGGGSLEDLAAFSTEPVARAVASSRTPIISGVGHEVDVSLADYAADLRAATPTDAARLVVPDRAEITGHVAHLSRRIETNIRAATDRHHHRITQNLGRLEGYLRHPRERTIALQQRLATATRALLLERNQRLASLERLLRGYDPRAVLERGYAIVHRPDGQVLRDPADAPAGTTLTVQLAKGELRAKSE